MYNTQTAWLIKKTFGSTEYILYYRIFAKKTEILIFNEI